MEGRWRRSGGNRDELGDGEAGADMRFRGNNSELQFEDPSEEPMKRYWTSVRNQLYVEYKLLLQSRYHVPIILGGVMQYVHNVAHNIVYMLSHSSQSPEDSPIDDSGYYLLPHVFTETPSNDLLTVMFVLVSAQMISPLIFVNYDERDRSVVKMVWRYLVVCSIAICLRILTFMATIMPSPGYHCQTASHEFSPPETWIDIFFRFDLTGGCGDLNFSSHMMYGLLAALTVQYYSPSRLFKGLMWVLTVALACLIIMQRDHWTVDVVVAWYTVPMLWYCCLHLFPEQEKSYKKIDIDDPERNPLLRPDDDAVFPVDEV